MKKCVRKFVSCSMVVLFLCVSMFNNANGDVFRLKFDALGAACVTLDSGPKFKSFIVANKENLPRVAMDPFVGDSAHATQMLGYAVFFPYGDSNAQPVYVAKKRKFADFKSTPITDHKTVYAEEFKLFSNFDHTERQLVSKILIDYRITTPIIGGNMYIFTNSAPCRESLEHNGNISCLAYYSELAKIYTNITFHILFSHWDFVPPKDVLEASRKAQIMLDACVENGILTMQVRGEDKCYMHGVEQIARISHGGVFSANNPVWAVLRKTSKLLKKAPNFDTMFTTLEVPFFSNGAFVERNLSYEPLL